MHRIILDTDPGVDDAIALLYLLRSPHVQLDAVTTVGGNVGLDVTTRNALAILDLAGAQDVPVYRGSGRRYSPTPPPRGQVHGTGGLGGVELPTSGRTPEHDEAARFIVEHTAAHPGEITLVGIGPLGNIAEALELDPTLPERVPSVMLMGGAEGTGNVTPSAEFNFWHDAAAAKRVFGAGFKEIRMVGLDATGQAILAPATREWLRMLDDPIAACIHAATGHFVDLTWAEHGRLGMELCDPLAAVALVRPDLVGWAEANVQICDEGPCIGRSIVGRTDRFRDLPANALVATSEVDARGVVDELLGTIFRERRDGLERVVAHEYR